MMFRLGLTGSIGMGKSTTAKLFAEHGCVVWDADAAVHRLYEPGGLAVAPLQKAFPGVAEGGAIQRDRLRALIAQDPSVLEKLEEIVHPLVQEDRSRFIENHADSIGVFDIPLLFETGGDKEMDATACVSVSRETQNQRVLARGSMTQADLDAILHRQMPNEEKCARATYVINTETIDQAREQVHTIMCDIAKRTQHNA